MISELLHLSNVLAPRGPAGCLDRSRVPLAHLYYYRGFLSLKTCRYETAIRALRRAVALAPRWPRLRLALGDALASQGQWQAAIAQYEWAVLLAPHRPDALAALGRGLLVTGRTAEAVRVFRRLQALVGEAVRHGAGNHMASVACWALQAGDACREAGQWDAAADLYRPLTRLPTETPLLTAIVREAVNELSDLLARQGQWEELAALVERTAADDPPALRAVRRGDLWRALGQPGRARAEYTLAIGLAQTDPPTGWVAELARRRQEALTQPKEGEGKVQ